MRVSKCLPLVLALTAISLAQDRAIVPRTRTVPTQSARKALVIGNKAYPRQPLANPVNDATDLAEALRSTGFSVTLKTNLGRTAMDEALIAFANSLTQGDSALVYFSGHGLEVQGQNYLLPVDFTADAEYQVKGQALAAGDILEAIKPRGVSVTVLVLDACRNNPYRSWARSQGGGLAALQAEGAYIAFAAAPGQVASDNPSERNGLFTKHLKTELAQPGASIDDVFNTVRERVYRESKSGQRPYSTTGLIGRFEFRGSAAEELEALRAESARLETEMAELRKKRDAATLANRQADGGRARELEARRRQAELDRQRLEDESRRQAAFEDLRKKREADAARQVKEEADEEARLAELRKTFEAERRTATGELTLDQARVRVAEIKTEIARTTEAINAEKLKAMERLTANFAAMAPPAPPPKDEFETTAVHRKRIDAHRSESAELEAKERTEGASLESRYQEELRVRTAALSAESEGLTSRKYRSAIRLTFGGYNADSERLVVKAGNRYYFSKAEPARARQLSAQLDLAIIEAAFTSDERTLAGELSARLPGEAMPFVFRSSSQGERRLNSIDGLTYVYVTPGTFTMGCSPGDNDCNEDEKPARQEKISKGFYLGESEVTQAAYERVTGKSPSNFIGPDLPVESVTWSDAVSYCQQIGGRLPSAAEWEFAARAGSTAARYGDVDGLAWYSGNSSGTTHALKRKEPNTVGVYDMLGNVWEWTSTEYGSTSKELRGGSWDDGSRDIRVSFRVRFVPSFRRKNVGFRCVWE